MHALLVGVEKVPVAEHKERAMNGIKFRPADVSLDFRDHALDHRGLQAVIVDVPNRDDVGAGRQAKPRNAAGDVLSELNSAASNQVLSDQDSNATRRSVGVVGQERSVVWYHFLQK